MFFATGHRPRTTQRVALGAAPDGSLASLIHEGAGDTSRYEQYTEPLTTVSSYMYSCPNVRTRYRLLPLDISTSTWMRGPGEQALSTRLNARSMNYLMPSFAPLASRLRKKRQSAR